MPHIRHRAAAAAPDESGTACGRDWRSDTRRIADSLGRLGAVLLADETAGAMTDAEIAEADRQDVLGWRRKAVRAPGRTDRYTAPDTLQQALSGLEQPDAPDATGMVYDIVPRWPRRAPLRARAPKPRGPMWQASCRDREAQRWRGRASVARRRERSYARDLRITQAMHEAIEAGRARRQVEIARKAGRNEADRYRPSVWGRSGNQAAAALAGLHQLSTRQIWRIFRRIRAEAANVQKGQEQQQERRKRKAERHIEAVRMLAESRSQMTTDLNPLRRTQLISLPPNSVSGTPAARARQGGSREAGAQPGTESAAERLERSLSALPTVAELHKRSSRRLHRTLDRFEAWLNSPEGKAHARKRDAEIAAETASMPLLSGQ